MNADRILAVAQVASLTGEATRATGLLGTATAYLVASGGGAWRIALARGKAGAAVALPIEGAALLAGLSKMDVMAAGSMGHALGVSHQIGDDAADLAADLSRGALNGAGVLTSAKVVETLLMAERIH